MADDSLEIQEELDFHPCNVPYSMTNYILNDLTAEQQKRLNVFKINTVRDNQKYLAAHPEVKAILVLIFKVLLKERPLRNPHLTIGKYFTKSSVDIREEIAEYLLKRSQVIGVNSTIIPDKSERSTISSFLEGEDRSHLEVIEQSEVISEDFPDEGTEKTSSSVSVAKMMVEEILEKTFMEFVDSDVEISNEESGKSPSEELEIFDGLILDEDEEDVPLGKSISTYLDETYEEGENEGNL